MDSSDSTPDKHKKTARRQFEIYLEFVRRHALLKKGWNVQKMHMAELNDIWRDMARRLNDCSGPSREMSHWKKVFTEWKSHTRRKLKYGKMLTDVEKDLIEVMGMCLLNQDEKVVKKKSLDGFPKKNKTVILQFPSYDDSIKNLSVEKKDDVNKDVQNVSDVNRDNNMTIKQEIFDMPNNSTNNVKSAEENMEITEPEEIQTKLNIDNDKTPSKILNEAQFSLALDQDISPLKNNGVDNNNKIEIKEKPKTRRASRKPKMISVSTNTSPRKKQVENEREQTSPKIEESLMAIASAINRYCGIIERRLF